MNTIKIAIADDNRQLVGLVKEYLDSQANMEVTAFAYNGKSCMKMLQENEIDILVLDIIMPYLDGIAVLDAMKEDEKLKDIEVIMLSAFGQDTIMSQAAKNGASYFIMKPFEAERLAIQINHIIDNRNKKPVEPANAFSKERASELLKEIGVPPHIRGFVYLKEAIALVLDKPEMLNKVTKSLYPAIADIFDATPTRVERSIRHAIELVWNRTDISTFARLIGYSEQHLKSKPTNSEFIAMVADRLRSEKE
ncbi:MAG TPA: sporulation transcription factor Spo0A [Planococcus sp. (in: firmicutes)]|nr:sporulation transcription factor Spo0A [Planococcus sp. (in: firmicutes)]